ncbi:hypothetical protein [Empedobacter brevis]|uniref:hypothetical protein n=1 Tax=Empedobacter brevis TaxID=247 RepID=UPI002FE0C9CE
MNMVNKKTIVIILISLIISASIYLFFFYLSVIDTKNISLSGYVLDEETKKPISNVLVVINNERYEDDKGNKNYDEYLGKDRIELYSDNNGYYSTTIEKSAFITLSFQKNNYIKKEEKGRYASKQMKYETYLRKER